MAISCSLCVYVTKNCCVKWIYAAKCRNIPRVLPLRIVRQQLRADQIRFDAGFRAFFVEFCDMVKRKFAHSYIFRFCGSMLTGISAEYDNVEK